MNTNSIEVTVIVPTYNRSKLLDMTLNSLTKQTFPEQRFEVIITDDGSFDNTKEIVNKYRNQLNLSYYFQEDKGYRVGSARNMGVENAKADIIIFLDSGVFVNAMFLKEHYYYYQNTTEKIALVGSVYGFCDDIANLCELETLIDTHPNLDELFRKIRKNPIYDDVREPFYRKYKNRIDLLPAPWVYYWTGNASFRKSYLYPGELAFDPIFDGNHGYEDCELGYKLHKRGVRILVNKNAESIHYPHDKLEDFREMQCNNLYKFHGKYNSFETQLLVEIQEAGLAGLDFNKYLIPKLKEANMTANLLN